MGADFKSYGLNSWGLEILPSFSKRQEAVMNICTNARVERTLYVAGEKMVVWDFDYILSLFALFELCLRNTEY